MEYIYTAYVSWHANPNNKQRKTNQSPPQNLPNVSDFKGTRVIPKSCLSHLKPDGSVDRISSANREYKQIQKYNFYFFLNLLAHCAD
jgi:hypothetical protein